MEMYGLSVIVHEINVYRILKNHTIRLNASIIFQKIQYINFILQPQHPVMRN